MIGVDTGFFTELKNDNPKAKEVWDMAVRGEEELMISVVSINEILVHLFKKGKPDIGKELLTSLKLFPNISLVPVSESIAEKSAGYRYGLGIPTVDSLILTTFVIEQCDKVISTDSHFLKAKEQNIIEVEYLESCRL